MVAEKQMEIQNDQLKELDKAQDTRNPQYTTFLCPTNSIVY